MLISLHLPKTAGVSFRKALKKRFGGGFLSDYADRSISKPRHERYRSALRAGAEICERDWAGIRCIHGHFLPIKYLALAEKRELTFVTWMRNPVDRIVSHYEYWLRSYNPLTAPPHQRRVVEERWSLERFCLGPEFRDLYGQYLRGFPLNRFHFIGITEFYEAELRRFSEAFIGAPLELYRTNVTGRRHKKNIDRELCERIADHHRADLELYRTALQMRKARIQTEKVRC